MPNTNTINPVQHVETDENRESSPSSPAQRKFNTLMGKINKQKIALAEWQKTKDEVQQDIAQKILPLQQQMAMENLRLALLLDDCILRYNLTKNQKRKIKEVITDLCAELAHQSAPIDDPAFDALCKRYYDKEAILAEQAAMEATMRATFEQTFGVKLEESDDIHDVDFLTQKLFEKLQADHLAEYPDDEDFTPPPKTHKTSKQRAQAEKSESDETLAQQSIQGIYRQLVQTLHPDRETDPSERERKTLVMQKVTVAYEEKNLVELLSLQQQEMKNAPLLHDLAESKIKAFIRLLESQLRQLKEETMNIEYHYHDMLDLSERERITPKKLRAALKDDIRNYKGKIEFIQFHSNQFAQSEQALKEWLKHQ